MGTAAVATTWRSNGVNVAVLSPSLTVMVTSMVVPMLLVAGVPRSSPVAGVKVAQVGLFSMEYDRSLLSTSSPTGVKV